jgi:hypothetical protein
MTNQAEGYNLLNKKEPLHEDLLPYYEDGGAFPMLRHPLIMSVPHSNGMNAFLNEQYKHKKEHAENLLKKKQYESYIYLHERPYRLQTFKKVEKHLDDMKYWGVLAEIWRDSENIWQNKSEWKSLLNSKRKYRDEFMSEEDRHYFDKMPEVVTVYRGYTEGKNEKGFSYTTDKSKAEWFSKRNFAKEGKVLTRKVNKSDIFAYTNERGENEVIILK